MKRLTKDKRIYALDPEAAPAVTIASGEELVVEAWDAFEGRRDPAAFDESAIKGGATGPIGVEGAMPGDALRIDFSSRSKLWGRACTWWGPDAASWRRISTTTGPQLCPSRVAS